MEMPFPGMDPYLDPVLWESVHVRLVTTMANQLQPPLRRADQKWANDRWAAHKAARPDLFPSASS